MKRIIEIRAGEGGQDAALLVDEQAAIYRRYARRHAIAVRERAGAG